MRLAAITVCLLLLIGGGSAAAGTANGDAGAGPSAPPAATAATTSPAADSGEKDEKSTGEKLEAWLKTWLSVTGLIIGALLIGAAVVISAIFLFFRWLRPSLTIEPFGDGGVDAKVGAVVTNLVQKRLSELSARSEETRGPYKLDVVVADVELLAGSGDLKKALGDVSEVSQLKLVVALLNLVDQKMSRRLTAKGELAPPGLAGHGIVLSLESGRNGVEANSGVWGATVPGSDPTDSKQPAPYYDLADRAAGWIQYQAGRSLDADVALMTKSADSFSLLSEALIEQRGDRIGEAADLYAKALDADPENIAALINLSALVAHYYGRYRWAVELLELARTALSRRYAEAG